MTILPIITKSLRYLFTQRLRAISSLLGVLFGVVAVITMLSIGEGAKKESLEQIHQLGVDNIIIRQVNLTDDQQSLGLKVEDAKLIANTLPSIRNTAPVKIIPASLHGRLKEISPEIISTASCFGSIYNLQLREGRFLSHIDMHRGHYVCVIGSEVANALGKDGHVGKQIRIENQLFTIVGVLNPRTWKATKSMPMSAHNFNQMVFLPIGAENGMPWKVLKRAETLSEIIVQVKPGHDTANLSRLLARTLEITHRGVEDYQIIIPQELIRQAQKTQDTFNLILGSIAFISLLVGGIGIMNIMLATISERTREIGIRRALGANKGHILLQFLIETLILTLSGALLGIFAGMLFSGMISWFAGWKTIITLYSVLLSLLLAVGVGIFSGLYPAIKASRMHPIAALRSY